MSRSNPAPAPIAQRYMAWAGGKGELQYYDKESQENITVELPFRFLVLDELTTITGWSDQDQSGIWSNEVRTTKDELIVRTKAGEIARGPYTDIKDRLKALGAKYARSVYIAYQQPVDDSFEWVIGNIKMAGSALSAWFDFDYVRKSPNYAMAVRLTGSTEDKKGATKFFVPTFELIESEKSELDAAFELDVELQKYLANYFDRKPETDHEPAKTDSEDVVIEDIDDKPIDLSEIPF